MPTYSYECQNCGEKWEEVWSVKERKCAQALYCAGCFGRAILLCGNNGGFRLGGGDVGWASTGYAATLGDAEIFEAKSAKRDDPYM